MMANLGFVIGVIIIFSFKGFANIKVEALISLLMIFFTSIAGSLEIIFQTKMRLDLKTIMDVSFPLLFLIFLMAFPFKINLIWVMILYLVARILSLGIGEKIIKIKVQFKLNRVWYWLKELWPMGVYLIVFTAYDRAVDSMMISRYMTMKDVAYYGLSYKIYNSLVQPAYFFVASIFPLLSSQIQEKKKLFFRSLALILGVLIIAAPILSMMAPIMIQYLGGAEFLPSVGVLRILIFAMIFAYVNHLFGFTLIAKRGQKSILLIGIIALCFNVLGNLYAIPRFGINGAALVTVYTEMLSSLLLGIRLWFLK
jgi:O-antigen/teichoic acid export membrane protein